MTSERPAERERADRIGDRAALLTRLAWVAILTLTGIFHFIRGAPVDAIIFIVAAVVLSADALGWVRFAPLGRERHPRRLLVIVLIAVATLVLAVAPLYGGLDSLVVVVIGLVLIPVVWPQPRIPAARARPDAVRRAAIAWSIVAVAGCIWEIGAFFLSRSSADGALAYPPLSDLVDPFIASPFTRTGLIVLWLIGGYALIRRGRSS